MTRPIHTTDIDQMVRVLAHSPVREREVIAADIIDRADIADRFRKRLGKLHPTFGDGSFGQSAIKLAGGIPKPVAHADDAYLDCLRITVAALQEWRARFEPSHAIAAE